MLALRAFGALELLAGLLAGAVAEACFSG